MMREIVGFLVCTLVVALAYGLVAAMLLGFLVMAVGAACV